MLLGKFYKKKFATARILYYIWNIIDNFSASVTQKAVIIENRKEKLSKLDEVLKEHNIGEENSVAKALIFGKTKKGVDFLGNKLSEKLGKSCITMHGDRSQEGFLKSVFLYI